MKKLLFVLMSAIMVMTMLLAASVSVAAVTPDSATPDDSPRIDTERAEYRERLKTFPMDEIASDDKVIVVLYETENLDDYTLDTFAAYGVIEIKKLTSSKILILTLDRHDKQNVLDVAYALYDIPGIHFAEPNTKTYPDDPNGTEDTPTETVNTAETTKAATPDTAQASKTNGTSATTKGGNAVATGDNYYISYIVFLMIAALLGAIIVRFRNTNFQ